MRKGKIGWLLSRKLWVRAFVVLPAILIWSGLLFAETSEHYAIDFNVISGGSGERGSTNYLLFDTLGQSSAIGTSNMMNYINHAGFWYFFLPDISVNPSPYDFERVFIGQLSSPKTFTVSNPGAGDLVIGVLGLTGTGSGEFEFQNDHCSGQVVASSGSCTFDVIFSPTSLGEKTATVSIPLNDPDDPDRTLEVTLRGRGVLLMVDPEEGTIGTIVEIRGEGLGNKKGKVVLQSGGVTYGLKVLEWNVGSSDVINAELTKAVVGGADCDVVVHPKGAESVKEPGGFTVKLPEVTTTDPSGGVNQEVTLVGNYFGTKKGRVQFETGQKLVSGRVTYWYMDAQTGASELRFVVPKKLTNGVYTLRVTNKVGTATVTFTVTD